MPMRSRSLTSFVVALAGLLLGGCTVYSGLQIGAAGTEPKPKVVLVSDFTFASDVVAIDRGYTARLERKVGTYPTHERRQRTTERVNDEIVATVVASLREAGLEAQPGADDAVTPNQSALVVSGGLRPGEPVTAKNKNSFGFGAGRGARARGRGRQRLAVFLGKQAPGPDFRCRTNGARERAAPPRSPLPATRDRRDCGIDRQPERAVISRRANSGTVSRARHCRPGPGVRQGTGLAGAAGTGRG